MICAFCKCANVHIVQTVCVCFAQNFGKNEAREPFARFHPAQNYGWSMMMMMMTMIRVMTRMRCHLTDRAGLDSNRDSLAARAQIVTLQIIYVIWKVTLEIIYIDR